MGRTAKPRAQTGLLSRCKADNSTHLRLVAVCKPGGPSETKMRCEGRKTATSRSCRDKHNLGKECVGGSAGEDSSGDDSDDDDEDEEDEDVEQTANKKLAEFHDLLKETTAEDVKRIDAALREKITEASAPPKGLESVMAKRVWKMAWTLTSVGQHRVQVGQKLQDLAASQSAWGRCLLATEIAGELLRQRLDQVQAKAARSRRQPPLARSQMEDGVTYFVKRMVPLVDEDGRCVAGGKLSNADASLVTFFNKELRQAYVDLTREIQASHTMARLSADAVFALDGEVKLSAATTDDSLARYETAVESTHLLYPLVAHGGKLEGCALPRYGRNYFDDTSPINLLPCPPATPKVQRRSVP